MKLLADECLDGRIVAWLRSRGHDVLTVRDTRPGAADSEVIQLACREGRVLLTEDKDFGELALRSVHPGTGVILLRGVGAVIDEATASLEAVLTAHAEELHDLLVVIQGTRTRTRKLL